MIIKRDYKNPSKHKHWKIQLELNFSYIDYGSDPVIKMYGYSSKDDPQRKFISKFVYVSDSRDDALSKEQELINNLYEYINNNIQYQKDQIKKQIERSNDLISLYEKWYEIPEIKGIMRGEKLDQIFPE